MGPQHMFHDQGPESAPVRSAFGAFLRTMPAERRKELRDKLTEAMKTPVDLATGRAVERDVTGTAGMTTSATLVPYALESPALYLWPVVTILRNAIPRIVVGGTGYHFKQVLNVKPPDDEGFVAEPTSSTDGTAGNATFDEADQVATFRTLGTNFFITFQALYGGKTTITNEDFEPQQLAQMINLYATMIAEEVAILGANRTALGAGALGTPSKTYVPTGYTEPAISQPTAGAGSLTAATNYYVRVSALTLRGWRKQATGNGGADSSGETDATTEVTITTAAAASPGDKAFTIGWNAVKGALAYNLYVSTVSGSGWKYQKTVTKNRGTIGLDDNGISQALIVTGNTVNTADTTGNTKAWDGLIKKFATQAGYWKSLGGATLTGDQTSGVNEFDDVFRFMFTTYQTSPSRILLSAADRKKVDKIILQGSAGPIFRINATAGDARITGALSADGMLNRYFNKVVSFVTHPYLVEGTMLFLCDDLGAFYPAANLSNTLAMYLSWDYMRIEFARTGLKDTWGTYMCGEPVLRVTFPLALIQSVG